MKTYYRKYLPLIIGVSCAIGIIIGSFLKFSGNPKQAVAASPETVKKLDRLIEYINYNYIEDVNTDSIVDLAISNILRDLDPHSTYIPKTEYEEVSETLEGDFVGIGVEFFRVHDTIAVIRTIEDGPSEKAGILPGDRIVSANGVSLSGKNVTPDSLKHVLRGKIDSQLNLKIKRQGEPAYLDITVKRDQIPLKSIDAAYMLTDDLAYIKMDRFSGHTHIEFKKAIKQFNRDSIAEIVLDLRDNGGGYLKQAIKIADEFLADGKLILMTKDKSGNVKKTYATKDGDLENSRVYVLINQNSASASEIVAGALQDNDIGTIIGQRSFGKGLVQQEMEFGDGSAVRLTVARYYTPTGRSIQKPYKGENSQHYFDDYIKRFHSGELLSKDSIHVDDSLKFTTPGGKIVYGGGGIIPDVFVPKDTNFKKESLDYMLKGGMMDRFVFDFLDKNRVYYNSLSLEDFESSVEIDDDLVRSFIAYLKTYNLNFDIEKYREVLKTYLKMTMARQLFNSTTSHIIVGKNDPVIKKVLELDAEQ